MQPGTKNFAFKARQATQGPLLQWHIALLRDDDRVSQAPLTVIVERFRKFSERLCAQRELA
jgi:hypothetical protein